MSSKCNHDQWLRFYVRNTKDSNCVLSPANVCKCVAMSQHDAKGETKVEMDHALGTAPQVSGSGAYDISNDKLCRQFWTSVHVMALTRPGLLSGNNESVIAAS
ncbi:uncharacterized protein LOC142345440 isoform X2 [Convolutriloba macropyga]|uniref:uncharacterized protein LOC142345440 isoform X2 n=1 Tax=Convolutriloba macropyga TaxID=536237 RepID=UPI003F51F629